MALPRSTRARTAGEIGTVAGYYRKVASPPVLCHQHTGPGRSGAERVVTDFSNYTTRNSYRFIADSPLPGRVVAGAGPLPSGTSPYRPAPPPQLYPEDRGPSSRTIAATSTPDRGRGCS